MPDEQRSSLRHRLLAFLVAGVGGFCATALSFGMAVYEAANPSPVPQINPGTAVETGRWTITAQEAWLADTPPTGVPPPQKTTHLTVALDIDNRAAASGNTYASVITLDPPVAGLDQADFYLARDNWVAGAIHPDMPERLIAVWEWPDGLEPPRAITLALRSEIYKPRDNLYSQPGWFERDLAARVTLPVRQEAGSAP